MIQWLPFGNRKVGNLGVHAVEISKGKMKTLLMARKFDYDVEVGVGI